MKTFATTRRRFIQIAAASVAASPLRAASSGGAPQATGTRVGEVSYEAQFSRLV